MSFIFFLVIPLLFIFVVIVVFWLKLSIRQMLVALLHSLAHGIRPDSGLG